MVSSTHQSVPSARPRHTGQPSQAAGAPTLGTNTDTVTTEECGTVTRDTCDAAPVTRDPRRHDEDAPAHHLQHALRPQLRHGRQRAVGRRRGRGVPRPLARPPHRVPGPHGDPQPGPRAWPPSRAVQVGTSVTISWCKYV